MQKYRKKPLVVEAIQLTNENIKEVLKWIDNSSIAWLHDGEFLLVSGGLGGKYNFDVPCGDYIVCHNRGDHDFYRESQEIFEASYEKV